MGGRELSFLSDVPLQLETELPNNYIGLTRLMHAKLEGQLPPIVEADKESLC